MMRKRAGARSVPFMAASAVAAVACGDGEVGHLPPNANGEATDGTAGSAGAFMAGAAGSPWGGAAGSPQGGAAGENGSTDVLWAVGEQGKIWTRASAGWLEVPSPTEANLSALWGSARDDIWAVGVEGMILHFDGEAWARVEVESGGLALRAIHGAASDDVWVVGDGGSVLHWNGEAWQRMASPTEQPLRSVRAISSDEAWIGGPVGGILEWDGSELREKTISAVPLVVRSFAHSPGHGLWAVGDIERTCTDWEDDELYANDRDIVLRRGAYGWTERYLSELQLGAAFSFPGHEVWIWATEELRMYSVPALLWTGGELVRVPELMDELRVRHMWGSSPNRFWAASWQDIWSVVDGIPRREAGFDVGISDLWGESPETPPCDEDCVEFPSAEDDLTEKFRATGCPEEGCELGSCYLSEDFGRGDEGLERGQCVCVGRTHEEDGQCVPNGACDAALCGGHGVCSLIDGQPTCECGDGFVPHVPAGCGLARERCTPQGWFVEDQPSIQALWSTGIWASGPDDVWVVGESWSDLPQAVVVHLNQAGWTQYSLGELSSGSPASGESRTDVSGTGPTDVWVLVEDRVYHFDGESWVERPIGSGSGLVGLNPVNYQTIHAPAPGEVYVAGMTHGWIDVPVLRYWNGAEWWNLRDGETTWFDQVCGDGVPYMADELMLGQAAREAEAREVLDTLGAPPIDLEPDFTPVGAVGLAADDLYAIDDTRILHFDGAQWAELPQTIAGEITELQRTPSGELWATDYRDVVHYDGTRWQWMTVDDCEDGVGFVSATGSGQVFGGCGANAIIEYDGTGWQFIDARQVGLCPIDVECHLSSIVGREPDDLWAAGATYEGEGSAGEYFVAHWDGTRWERTATSVYHMLEAADADGGLWAFTGDHGTIARFDGTDWEEWEFEAWFRRLIGLAADAAWAIAPDRLLHWDGERWTEELTGNQLSDVWIDASGEPWVVSDRVVLRRRGADWVEYELPGGWAASTISASSTHVWVGGRGAPFISHPLD